MAKRKEIKLTFKYSIDGKRVTKEYFIEQLKVKHNPKEVTNPKE